MLSTKQFCGAEDVMTTVFSAWYVLALPSTSEHRNMLYFIPAGLPRQHGSYTESRFFPLRRERFF
jgi:hypothetical protein